MSAILDRIIAAKRREVEEAKQRITPDEIERRARSASAPRGFERALRAKIAASKPAVIAEIKRASPSRGLIRADFDPARIAATYEKNGAACLSVLTDREFFGGAPEDLVAARGACALPVIRKDFMVDPYQVHEARAWGADCILLILDAVPDAQLRIMAALAADLGMDVLAESHDAAQLERAARLPARLLGINNRDLRTFQVDRDLAIRMRPRVPADRIIVAESGIRDAADVARLRAAGVDAMLVGETLMRAPDPAAALKALVG